MKKFYNFVTNKATEDVEENIELRISGDIVDDGSVWFYEWFDEPCAAPNNFRNELKACNGKDITVWIDSNGGDVFAGAGIYNALKEYKGNVTIKIDGRAISAASVIAMAGDKILMSPASIMMIHNPATYAAGEVKDMQKAIDVLNEVKETIINVYELKTGLTRKEISDLMDSECWMGTKKAIENGFADGTLYEEEQDDSVTNGIIKGAKLIFNSLKFNTGTNSILAALDGGFLMPENKGCNAEISALHTKILNIKKEMNCK